MREPRFVVIRFMLLGFGVSLIVLTEDVPETAYDKSEALLYEHSSPRILHPIARFCLRREIIKRIAIFRRGAIMLPIAKPVALPKAVVTVLFVILLMVAAYSQVPQTTAPN
ncbi:MAG: hypothetical protein WAN18_16510, partial [Candidatus Sulfotelmatobacter sp.]